MGNGKKNLCLRTFSPVGPYTPLLSGIARQLLLHNLGLICGWQVEGCPAPNFTTGITGYITDIKEQMPHDQLWMLISAYHGSEHRNGLSFLLD